MSESRGERLVRETLEQFDLDVFEHELLQEAGRQLDLVDRLHAENADPRELRQQRGVLIQMLLKLKAGRNADSPRSRAARRAARGRWGSSAPVTGSGPLSGETYREYGHRPDPRLKRRKKIEDDPREDSDE